MEYIPQLIFGLTGIMAAWAAFAHFAIDIAMWVAARRRSSTVEKV